MADLVKKARAKALKAGMSALKGCSESHVLEEFYTKLEILDVKQRLVDIHIKFPKISKRLKDSNQKLDCSWHEKHNEEGFDVLALLTALVVFTPKLKDEVESTKLSEKELFANFMQGREHKKVEFDRAHAKA